MSLFTIGDLHLSNGVDKPMDVFGGRWENYMEKLADGLSVLTDADTLVICGDVSWGMGLDECLADMKYIDALPGQKIILKGNHDYWWNTATKIKAYFAQNEISTISILHNNCYFYNDIAICGSRGWFYEENTHGGEHDKKIMNREVQRVKASLMAAGDCKDKRVFLHYPPRFNDFVCTDIIDLLNEFGVKHCYYGHIHGIGHKFAVTGPIGGIEFHMVSADYTGFKPILISKD